MKYILFITLMIFTFGGYAQTLNDYLKIGAENNPGLKAKFTEYEASLEKMNQVGSLPSPVLDFGYFISPVETRNGPQQAKIGLMQMFPWMGTLSAKEEVFAHFSKAKYESFESAKKQLFYQLKSTWYEMSELQQSIIIIKENLKILQTFEALATQKFESGTKTGMVDVLRIQMEIAELENKLLLIYDMLKLKKVIFNNLLNRERSTEFDIPQQQIVLNIKATKENMNDSILNQNNELKGLNMKKEAFKSSAVAAKKQGLPMIGVGLSYFMVGETNLAAPNSGRDALMPMVSMTVPIYRKRYKAQVKEANLKSDGVNYQIENKKNLLNTALQVSWVKYDDATRRIDLYNNQNQKAKQTLEIILISYTNSGKDFEEILRIQRMMLGYDLSIINAIKDNNISVSKIEALY